jgi:hypothetical protein
MYEPPPGTKKEREREDDEPEYKFEWQRKFNAPREEYVHFFLLNIFFGGSDNLTLTVLAMLEGCVYNLTLTVLAVCTISLSCRKRNDM